ncbi:MAG: pilus assembly protein PilM [Clostridiales bacterium]|jgi:type IV pilus assembly protein PilM|nr:pilus assembly protein PilM [Clostridiales bacterium]
MRLRQKNIIGLDIGTGSIKLIRIDRKGTGEKCVIGYTPQGLVSNQGILSEDLLADEIAGLMREHKIISRRCSLCLPSQHVISRTVFLPLMEKDMLVENIRYDIEDYLPLDPEEYFIDYRIMRTLSINEKKHWHVLITAVLRNTILSYTRVLNRAGLNPIYIDVPYNCLEKLLSLSISGMYLSAEDRGDLCIVDIGSTSANIILFSEGCYFVDSTVFFENANTSFDYQNDANVLGRASANSYHDFTATVSPDRSRLFQVTDEVIKTLRYYSNQSAGNNLIKEIVLLGGGSLIPDLPDYLRKSIGLPVTRLSSWMEKNKAGNIKGISDAELMIMGKAIGSTMRRD